jgi:hypothetical protein
MNYRQKYLKYKTKYLKLKGGMDQPGESSNIFNIPDRMNMCELEDNEQEDYEQEDYEQEDMNQSSCVSTDLNQFNVRNHWYSNDIKYFLPKYDVPKYDVHKKYYLPCEITKITKNLFMNNNIVNLIKQKIYSDNDIFKNIITMNSNITFYQDPLIFLKNNDEQGNDMVFIDDQHKTKFNFGNNINSININIISAIDKGGNFIASPKIGKNKSVVFYLNGYYNIGDPIKNAFNKYLDQELVELNCSFTVGGTRHIDEIMTFIPYDEQHNPNKFKVWIYYIRNIEFDICYYMDNCKLTYNRKEENINVINKLNKKIDLITDINIKQLVTKIRDDIKYLQFNRGIINETDIIKINMFNLEDMNLIKKYFFKNTNSGQINYDIMNNTSKQKLITKLNERLKTVNNYNNEKVIYYLLDTIKNNRRSLNDDIFNNKLFTFNIDELTYLNKYINRIKITSKLQFKNEHQIREILENERLKNLDIISRRLFNSNYHENYNNFVEFPIDLIINNTYDAHISKVPIFNRVWYESDTKCIGLFSTGDPSNKNIFDDNETELLFNNEKEYIKSYLDPYKTVEFFKINTKEYHSMGNNKGNAGGNLHCLIKSQY